MNPSKFQYLIAQTIVNKAIAEAKANTPQFPLTGPMEDCEQLDIDSPPSHWNTWGDAGLLTRPHIYAKYTLQDQPFSPVHTEG